MKNCRLILEQGLQELDIATDENKLETLLAFLELIEKWNKTYNLTSIRNREEMARLHILDSLTTLPYVQGSRIADIGTGGGIPGIPLAIFLTDTEFTLVDSNSKKTRFVQQAILELKLKNVKVVCSRVENMQTEPRFTTVLMRAFSNLEDILHLTRHLIEPEGILLAMKGLKPVDELANIVEQHSIISVNVPGIEAERCLVRIVSGANNE